MGIAELIDGICNASFTMRNTYTYKHWNKARSKRNELIEKLEGQVRHDFTCYLHDNNPKITSKKYKAIILNRDYRNKKPTEKERDSIPFTPENLFVKISIGKETVGSEPSDVTKEFRDFVERSKPLDIRVYSS